MSKMKQAFRVSTGRLPAVSAELNRREVERNRKLPSAASRRSMLFTHGCMRAEIMSKLPMVFATVLAGVWASAAAAAQNVTPPPTQGARTRRVEGLETMPYVAPASSAGSKAAQRPLNDRNCLRQTGSHIPPKDGKCIPMPGRAYNKEDLDRTGERQLGPALRKLDPSVSGH